MKTVGIVLAGGLSRRFGSPKAFAKLEGQYFYTYAVDALKPYCEEIIIVTRSELVAYFPTEFHVIVDDLAYRGDGPLAGIYSAMKASLATRYLVLPCDMPYMNEQFIKKLLAYSDGEITAVRTKDYDHPLVSVWKRTVFEHLKQTLDKKQLRVVPFFHTVNTTWIDGALLTDEFHKVLTNINHQEDLERGEET